MAALKYFDVRYKTRTGVENAVDPTVDISGLKTNFMSVYEKSEEIKRLCDQDLVYHGRSIIPCGIEVIFSELDNLASSVTGSEIEDKIYVSAINLEYTDRDTKQKGRLHLDYTDLVEMTRLPKL